MRTLGQCLSLVNVERELSIKKAFNEDYRQIFASASIDSNLSEIISWRETSIECYVGEMQDIIRPLEKDARDDFMNQASY